MSNYIVCGWYTPDYAYWLDTLLPSLDAVGAPHDFVEIAKREGGWEKNTMSKAGQVLAAMDRHPGKTIIFLDVDCVVLGSLDDLARSPGDVAAFIETKAKPKRSTFQAWSGTLVFQPTSKARELVKVWVAESERQRRYAVDQTSLAVALGKVPGLTVTTLDRCWCARPEDNVPDPVILHDSASRNTKTSKWTQRLHRWRLAA